MSAMPPPPPPIEPGAPTAAAAPPAHPLPWEQPDRPFVEALFETVKLFVVQPKAAYDRMQKAGDLARPVLYAVIIGWIGVFFGQLYSIALSGFQMDMMRNMGVPGGYGGAGMSTAMNLGIIVLAPVLILIWLAIETVVFHLCLMLAGGANGGFDTTLRTCCYATTAQLAGIIPLCGGLAALVWAIVLLIIGLAIAHRTTQGKAAVAVFLPLVLCCVCAVVLGVMFGAGLAGLANR